MQDTITLLNGRTLELHPRRADESAPAVATREEFNHHAYFLLLHADEILSDSRMFLAPVTPPYIYPYLDRKRLPLLPLGAFVEWWRDTPRALLLDEATGEFKLSVDYAKMPLSGTQVGLTLIDRNGQVVEATKAEKRMAPWSKFHELWRRYADCMTHSQSFALGEVVQLLRAKSVDLDERHGELLARYRQLNPPKPPKPARKKRD